MLRQVWNDNKQLVRGNGNSMCSNQFYLMKTLFNTLPILSQPEGAFALKNEDDQNYDAGRIVSVCVNRVIACHC